MTKKPQKLHWEYYYESEPVSICVLQRVCWCCRDAARWLPQPPLDLGVPFWVFFFFFGVTVLHRSYLVYLYKPLACVFVVFTLGQILGYLVANTDKIEQVVDK